MRSLVTLLLFIGVATSSASAQEVICVNGSAPPPRVCRDITLPDGRIIRCAEAAPESISGNTCWENAYIDLQDALDEAATLADQGNLVEVWVAAGTYHPDRGTGDRTMSYSLHKNVELYGGFAGWETYRDQRDFVINETILSGDLNEDDNPDGSFDGGTSDCCTARDTPGCDDPVCEAIICPKDSPRESECCTRLWSSVCAFSASVICCNLCSTRNDCDNALNVMTAFDTDTSAIVDGFIVTSGRADSFPSAIGAGIRIEDGGATLRNCTLRNNVAAAITTIYARSSDVIVKNCLITDNLAFGNSPAFGSQTSGSAIVEDTVFSFNAGGGLWLVADRGTVRRTTFIENNGTAVTVGFRTRATIDDSRFIRNSVQGSISGAGINTNVNSQTTITNCEFIGNESISSGAAIRNSGIAEAYNCLFTGNRGGGAVFFNGFGSAYLEHCTFVDNEIGGVDAHHGIVELKHCILWNNRNYFGETSLPAQFRATRNQGIARASYTVLQGYDGPDGKFPGPGNTGAAPMFVDEDGPDDIPGNEDDNLRLRPDSPLIDAGDPDATLFVDRDLDGHTRILCGRVDFGPYELGIGDFDCNGLVDLSDLADLPACMTNPGETSTTAPCNAFDFNADKAVDLADYAALQSIIMSP